MKLTRQQLQEQLRSAEHDRDAYMVALNELLNHRTTRFTRGKLVAHVARPTGAAGGIVALKRDGMTTAHYFETWMDSIRKFIPRGDDSEGIALRDLAFEIERFIRSAQEKMK